MSDLAYILVWLIGGPCVLIGVLIINGILWLIGDFRRSVRESPPPPRPVAQPVIQPTPQSTGIGGLGAMVMTVVGALMMLQIVFNWLSALVH